MDFQERSRKSRSPSDHVRESVLRDGLLKTGDGRRDWNSGKTVAGPDRVDRWGRNDRARYERELRVLRMEHRELADLRTLVFNQELNQPERPEKNGKQYSYPYETRKRTVIFGGHDSFLKAIKPMLPTVRFVDAGNQTFDPDIVRNADVVWVQNNCIGHSQYWNIARNCRQAGVQMRYFGFASAEKCAE